MPAPWPRRRVRVNSGIRDALSAQSRPVPIRPLQFCDDAMLNYASLRRVFRPGDTLDFDPAYRLAHLPLVAPHHPASIRAVPGQDYRDGTYVKPRYSLVAPVRSRDLIASPAFQALEAELRAASFAPKIAWDLGERRAAKLHATVVNGLPEANAEACAAAVTRALARLGPLSFRLGGPFVGNRNLGRIYFPVYPQAIDGDDSFGLIQDAAGSARTRFYVVGYYNLIDELGPAETADLAQILERWGPATILATELSSLVVHATNDDLALSGRPVITIGAQSRT
jgi:hypothetical protein